MSDTKGPQSLSDLKQLQAMERRQRFEQWSRDIPPEYLEEAEAAWNKTLHAAGLDLGNALRQLVWSLTHWREVKS